MYRRNITENPRPNGRLIKKLYEFEFINVLKILLMICNENSLKMGNIYPKNDDMKKKETDIDTFVKS